MRASSFFLFARSRSKKADRQDGPPCSPTFGPRSVNPPSRVPRASRVIAFPRRDKGGDGGEAGERWGKRFAANGGFMEARKNFEIRVFFSFRGRGDRALYPRASTTTRALAYRLRYLERDLFLGQEHGDKEEEEKRVAKRSREPNRLESSEGPNFSLCFFPLPSQTPTNQSSKAQRESERAFPLSLSSLFLLFRLQKGRRASYKSH